MTTKSNDWRNSSADVLTRAYAVACVLKVYADFRHITSYEELGKVFCENAKGKGQSKHLGTVFCVCEECKAQSLTILVKTSTGVAEGYKEQLKNIDSEFSEEDEMKATMLCFKDNKEGKYQKVIDLLEKEIEKKLKK